MHAVSWPGHEAREGMRHRNGEESHVLSPIYAFHAEPLLLQARPPEPTCHAGGPGAQAHPEQNEAGTYHFKPFMPTAQAPSSREDTVALPASEAAPPHSAQPTAPAPASATSLPVLSIARGPRRSWAAPHRHMGAGELPATWLYHAALPTDPGPASSVLTGWQLVRAT